MDVDTIVVLEGDETGQELLEESLRVLAPDVIGFEVDLPRYDLSLESRRKTENGVVHEAAAAITEHGLGLKAATITPEGKDDVGSPNRLIREEIGGKVIVRRPAHPRRRSARRCPPISVVRMAVGDAYGAKEWREGDGEEEVAFRTERIERRICRSVAEFAFRLAERTSAKVFGGPKYTVSPVYEGMLKEEMDAAAERHPEVPYDPQLIDATFAYLVTSSGAPLVIPTLNRDGDVLSGPRAAAVRVDRGRRVAARGLRRRLRARRGHGRAAHGTAPALQGRRRRTRWRCPRRRAALLGYGEEQAQEAGRAIREGALEAVAEGSGQPI